jgi:hypothetical protein
MSAGLRLYRGITPKSLGLDIHGGYGETWTRDRDDAQAYVHSSNGYVLEAVLHPSAKRMAFLAEPDSNGQAEFIEENLQLLAKMVKQPWLAKDLNRGWSFLWDVWRPNWTRKFIWAGYDSLHTAGFDGPEVYVLNPAMLQIVGYYRVYRATRGERRGRKYLLRYEIEPDTLADTLARLGYIWPPPARPCPPKSKKKSD